MNPELTEPIKQIIGDLPAITMMLVIGQARATGLIYGFAGFAWAGIQNTGLRISIALAFSIPVMAAELKAIVELVKSADAAFFMALTIKEAAFGYILGVVISLPLFAVQYSGFIIDSYRGELGASAPDPAGGIISSTARIYMVSALLIFATVGGFWYLAKIFYQSYQILPMFEFVPRIKIEVASTALSMADWLMRMALVGAAPILLILIAADFIQLVMARGGRNMSTIQDNFMIKNLITALLIPVTLTVLVSIMSDMLPESMTSLFEMGGWLLQFGVTI